MPTDISSSAFCSWLRFKHLVLIDTLARTRNMHTTAQLMNLSQPALSKMLRDLEDQFGFALFERLPRSMPPTELGEHVVRYAQVSLNDSQRFVDQVNRLRKGGHGSLKVGGIFAATSVVLPEAIALIKSRSPLLSIEVVEQSSDHLLEMLEQNKLDLIIGRFTDERFIPLFDFQPLGPEPFCLVVNHRHPLSTQGPTPVEALSDWPWILYPVGAPIRTRMEAAFSAVGIPTPANTVDTISMPIFLHLLQSGPMIAMLPESMVQGHIQNGLLKVLDTPLQLAPLDYGILTRKHERLTGATREFADILLEFARQRRAGEIV
ncbi:LysR family transcriptional regulator [Pseudomonas fluorescens]|uniref:HTH-type transcriptional regulator GbpR n=1 Tax=Pseudomonas fluorescens TaxID=294 RepID=A0A5E7CXT4_PSEFL|nr:LysR family transcriptional regulator [Pseudomonas fluorescens]VVO06778.1 HTH-type transcriptional regulator GbpR [Pseudomonas fluorescens]